MLSAQGDFIGRQRRTTFDHVEIEIFESARLCRLTLKPNETRSPSISKSAATTNPDSEHFLRRSDRMTEHMAPALFRA